MSGPSKSRTLVERFFSKIATAADGCWLWRGDVDAYGYGVLNIDGSPKKAHRVMWQIATGESPPDRMSVCHRCDQPRCVRPSHLFLGTHAENNADKTAKGRQAQGAAIYALRWRNGLAKMGRDGVLAIRSGYAAGASTKELADAHGLSRGVVWGIVSGRTYKEVV